MTDPLAGPSDGDDADAAAPGGAGGEGPALEWVECWRCGKAVDRAAGLCPYCRARVAPEEGGGPGPRTRDGPTEEARAIVRIVWVFVALLATSVGYGLSQRLGA